ncbi:MAG: pilus assembly protein N-terminal domain-containing protein [Alphaproteobacteria bacterium]|nr:pilus assembly protein N-terminal domain-containing protein [Alphaproteobacteria bacterium]
MRRVPPLALLVSLLAAMPALAEDALHLDLWHAKALKLPRDARYVTVGDPTVVDVTVESPRLMFLIGHNAGVTNLIALDADGQTILEKKVVVLFEGDTSVMVHSPNSQGGVNTTHFGCQGGRCLQLSGTRGAEAPVGAANAIDASSPTIEAPPPELPPAPTVNATPASGRAAARSRRGDGGH